MLSKKNNYVMGLMLLAVSDMTLAESRTLSNLEHERVAFFGIVTDDEMTPFQREQQLATSQRRLMDLERMAIRDDRLLGSKDPRVKKAFNSYETTFLVHASAEANHHIVDFWLQQLQLDTKQILASKRGRR